jgi:predicted membrane GTPase involved in stress response
MKPLLDAIVRHVPPPRVKKDAPFSMLVTMIEHDNYLGRIATGRVASGNVKEGSPIKSIRFDDKPEEIGKVCISGCVQICNWLIRDPNSCNVPCHKVTCLAS